MRRVNRYLMAAVAALGASAALTLVWSTADGQTPGPAAADLHLPAQPPSASGYAVVDDLPGLRFDLPLGIASPSGETERLFVLEKGGRIIVVTDLHSPHPTRRVFLDIPEMLRAKGDDTLATDSEWGLLGLAFHPHYAENGCFYVAYDLMTHEGGRNKAYNRLARFTVAKTNPDRADPDSETPLISQLDLAGNHDGGDLHFGTDGYLYYSMGDEGGGNDTFDNGRFIDKDFFAAIFRLDVDRKPGSLAPNPHHQNSQRFPSAVHPDTYRIPPDNPFLHALRHRGRDLDPGRIRTEIYATGLRNPWRFTFDSVTGRMFAADVGQDRWEEVDLVTPGGDYGWSLYEGTHPGPHLAGKTPDAKLIDPIYEYPHQGPAPFNGNCIIGGVVYRGTRLTELYGAYLFCDFGAKRIWSLSQIDGKWTASYLTADSNFAGFGTDPATGEVLLADYGGGRIKRLVRSGTAGPQPPALLSQTGAFADVATLTPASGLVPYTPNVAFWSDYALKHRWFALPDPSAKIAFSPDGNWGFPAGMVWVKHFDLELRRGDPTSRRRIETRFLVKTAQGVYGLTYQWRADQADADLVPEEGREQTFAVTVNGVPHAQTWHYPARSECLACHTAVTGGVLGFNTRQLNGPDRPGAHRVNQLQALSDAGYFTAPVTGVAALPAYAPAQDKTQSLETRVRSYLAVNCAQCHQPGGAGQGLWDARAGTATAAAHLIDGALLNDGGDPAMRWAVPGDPAHSMVLARLRRQGPGRMPPLASSELDPQAVGLLRQWIEQLAPGAAAGR
jgi:uncharacterized repeat protein (TIGR03806 family)